MSEWNDEFAQFPAEFWEAVCVVGTLQVSYLINVFKKRVQKKMLELDAVLKSSFLTHDCIQGDEGHLTFA